MPNPQSIIVTGSSGFVGSRLVKALENEGHTVYELDLKTGHDLTDWESLKFTRQVDVIFHLAAITFVPHSFERPREFFDTNFRSTLHMLELARKFEACFVLSSSYVYGPPDYLPIDEAHPTKPNNPYMASKILSEDLCKSYARSFGVPITIVRPFNIYGPNQPENFLIPTMVKGLNEGKISLKDSRPKRDMVYVNDVVNAYMKTLNLNHDGVEVFNIGQGISYSIREMAEAVVKVSGKEVEIYFSEEQRPNEVLDTVADIAKAKELLGWKPEFTLESGLKEILL